MLRRAGLERRSARLAAAEALAASEGGPITERVLRELRAVEVTHRHIGSDVFGEQVFLDTMYVGKLKGVGKIWQYSALFGACSMGFAHVRAGEKSAKASARFLEHHVLPVYREAGITLVEVVVDGGPEFKGEFARTCRRLGISCPPAPPAFSRPQRLRRTVPGHGAAPALPHGVPVPLLYLGSGHRRRPPSLVALLQLRAAPPWVPH